MLKAVGMAVQVGVSVGGVFMLVRMNAAKLDSLADRIKEVADWIKEIEHLHQSLDKRMTRQETACAMRHQNGVAKAAMRESEG